MTLVEVLLGTALLGTLLASILLSQARITAQSVRAQARVEGCRIADELLANWWARHDEMPREGTGEVDNHPGWRWQMRRAANTQGEAFNADVLTLVLFSPQNDAVTTVDLLVPVPDQEQPETQENAPTNAP